MKHPTPAAAIEAGKRAADELLKTFPHIGGQDVIADPHSPTGLWLAEWDGSDWIPKTDESGARIPAKPK